MIRAVLFLALALGAIVYSYVAAWHHVLPAMVLAYLVATLAMLLQ